MKDATHVVMGKVHRIYTRDQGYLGGTMTNYVLEVQVAEVEKGQGPMALQFVFARMFKLTKPVKDTRTPGSGGHEALLPKEGDTIRLYLDDRYGSYDVLNNDKAIEINPAKK